MKYILLDFDGVLTSEFWTRQCIFECRRENMFGLDWFDPGCLQALQTIVDATGAGIVVSSSWRELGDENLQRLWTSTSMPGRFLGTTPIWILTKREAIEEWIHKHQEDKYVILDDDSLGFANQVKTDIRIGLTNEKAQKAISILNDE